jgi:RHS repeat-associated protein
VERRLGKLTRVTFADLDNNGLVTATEILQQNHYFPFGGSIEGLNSVTAPNKYQYNGKEWNADFGLEYNDYGARFYDPWVGRWWSVDPLAEKFGSHSPYVYGLNNPISVIDPNGMSATVYTGEEAKEMFRALERKEQVRNLINSTKSDPNEYAYNSQTGEFTKMSDKGGSDVAIVNNVTKNGDGSYSPTSDGTPAIYEGLNAALINGKYDRQVEAGETPTHSSYDLFQMATGAISPVDDPFTMGLPSMIKSLVGNLFVAGGKQVITEGIYEFTASSGKTYIGQSQDIPRRILEHIASGKLGAGSAVKTTQVLGGKTAREVSEQLRIEAMGGIRSGILENVRNPIGPARAYLLPKI